MQVSNPRGHDKLFTYDAVYDNQADTQTIYDEMVTILCYTYLHLLVQAGFRPKADLRLKVGPYINRRKHDRFFYENLQLGGCVRRVCVKSDIGSLKSITN